MRVFPSHRDKKKLYLTWENFNHSCNHIVQSYTTTWLVCELFPGARQFSHLSVMGRVGLDNVSRKSRTPLEFNQLVFRNIFAKTIFEIFFAKIM